MGRGVLRELSWSDKENDLETYAWLSKFTFSTWGRFLDDIRIKKNLFQFLKKKIGGTFFHLESYPFVEVGNVSCGVGVHNPNSSSAISLTFEAYLTSVPHTFKTAKYSWRVP